MVSGKIKPMLMGKSNAVRPQTLSSRKVVIGSDELCGQSIDKVVRQKIETLEKSPTVVKSTAIIIKTSISPARPKSNGDLTSLVNGGTKTNLNDHKVTHLSVRNGGLVRATDTTDSGEKSKNENGQNHRQSEF